MTDATWDGKRFRCGACGSDLNTDLPPTPRSSRSLEAQRVEHRCPRCQTPNRVDFAVLL